MLGRILRHEWRGLGADRTTAVLAIVFGLAIGYAVWNGTRWVRFQHQALAEVAQEETDRYAAITRQLAGAHQ